MTSISTRHQLVIRPMRRTDAPALANMMSGLAAYHGDKSITQAQHFTTYCLGPKKIGDAWIALIDQTPLGFAITYDWMNFVRAKPGRTLDLLFVEDGFRSLGIGEALVATAAKDALKKGLTRFTTSAALTNRKANAFYKRLGFEKAKHHSNRYGIEGTALLKLSKKTKL